VDQGSRLQSVVGPFLSQLLGSQLAQFIVDDRQELLGSERITLVDG
jgi:hypothetical protein